MAPSDKQRSARKARTPPPSAPRDSDLWHVTEAVLKLVEACGLDLAGIVVGAVAEKLVNREVPVLPEVPGERG